LIYIPIEEIYLVKLLTIIQQKIR